MIRALLMLGALLALGPLMAQATTDVHCTHLGTGGGRFVSGQHTLVVATAQSVIGISETDQHRLRHGVWPCGYSITTDVPDDGCPECGPPGVVHVLELHPNVPNPFNPGTEIRYGVPVRTGPVSLRVFDVQGRRVRTLVENDVSAGRKSVFWNGLDDAGRPVASGVYYSILDAPGTRLTRKMTLVK